MNAIFAENLNKEYSGKQILSDLNLKVKSGDIYGLVGLNGIGKTTLIRILLGISAADSGRIMLLDTENIKRKLRKKICYLPEKFNPSQELTGKELIKILGRFHRSNIEAKEIGKWCERFEFDTDYLNKKIRNYSKGMVQKIGLISTFITNAKLFILDEPMSGLDFRARNILKEEIQLLKKKGATIFFTSHVLSDINDLCDNVGLLNDGRLIFEGSLENLKKKHKNIETAVINTISNK